MSSQASSVAWSPDAPQLQVDPRSGHMEETSEYIDAWNNKVMFSLTPSPCLCLPFPLSFSKNSMLRRYYIWKKDTVTCSTKTKSGLQWQYDLKMYV